MALPDPSDEVVTRVKTLAATESRPTLTDDQVKAAIRQYPAVDRDGIPADQIGWTPTWDIYRAVAELWDVKAGLVAGDFNFGADGANYGKGDVLAHCLAMSAKYGGMVSGSADTRTYGPEEPWMTDRLQVNG